MNQFMQVREGWKMRDRERNTIRCSLTRQALGINTSLMNFTDVYCIPLPSSSFIYDLPLGTMS